MLALFLTFVAVGQALIGVAAKTHAFTAIPVGSSLHLNPAAGPNTWISPSGRFAFGFYPEGKEFSIGINMFISPTVEPLVIWTAQSAQGIKLISKEAVLSFTKQGLFLTPSNGAKTIPLIGFNGTEVTGASFLNSGNFVVYESNTSNFIWQSFDNPTNTMMGGQVLNCGTGLTSRRNSTDQLFYDLTMQCDSNLVLYSNKMTTTADGNTTSERTPVWASQTWDSWSYDSSFLYTKLILDKDGRLFLSTTDGAKQLYLTKYKPNDNRTKNIYYATLDSNKFFRLFALNLGSNRSTLLYEIPTLNDACQVAFLCGVNSYCLISNSSAECRCLPGFNFTDSGAPNKGCKRSITQRSCRSGTSSFSMEHVENLVCYDEAYSIVPVESEDDCRDNCLAECNCEAAVYFNKNCAKHKLPISRAAKGNNFTIGISTAYIKIGKTEENQRRSKVHLKAALLCSAINAGVFLALLVAGTGSFWLFYGRYRLLWGKWELAFQEEVAPRSFSFQELAKATNSFASELGRGGHAIVFKGYLSMYGRPNPVPVAVKRLSPEEEKAAESDFHAEIRIIGRAHHVNLVRLLGFCYEDSKRLLIYEYMSKGSLANLILQSDNPPSWKKQAMILFAVARGINYLHRECETKIIHRDIKPENILIDENWRVKISDFGISKLLVGGSQATTTKRTSAPGTSGYVAPECIQSKGENVTEKADVYSFGIVILETIFWERNTADNNLLESAQKYCEEIEAKMLNKEDLADTELEKSWMLKLGMACVQENPDVRPDMEDVVLCKLKGVPSPTTTFAQKIVTSQKKISWAPKVK